MFTGVQRLNNRDWNNINRVKVPINSKKIGCKACFYMSAVNFFKQNFIVKMLLVICETDCDLQSDSSDGYFSKEIAFVFRLSHYKLDNKIFLVYFA